MKITESSIVRKTLYPLIHVQDEKKWQDSLISKRILGNILVMDVAQPHTPAVRTDVTTTPKSVSEILLDTYRFLGIR